MRYIKRDMEGVVARLPGQCLAILVTGPRGAGKTTILQNLMKGTGRTYVSIDDFNTRASERSGPAMFFQIYKTPIVML